MGTGFIVFFKKLAAKLENFVAPCIDSVKM